MGFGCHGIIFHVSEKYNKPAFSTTRAAGQLADLPFFIFFFGIGNGILIASEMAARLVCSSIV